MKKIILGLVIGSLLMLMIPAKAEILKSVNLNDNLVNNSKIINTKTTKPTKPQLPLYNIGRFIKVGNTSMLINFISYSDTYNDIKASDNEIFAIINMDICITSNSKAIKYPSNAFVNALFNNETGIQCIIEKYKQIKPNIWSSLDFAIKINKNSKIKKLIMQDCVSGEQIEIVD